MNKFIVHTYKNTVTYFLLINLITIIISSILFLKGINIRNLLMIQFIEILLIFLLTLFVKKVF